MLHRIPGPVTVEYNKGKYTIQTHVMLAEKYPSQAPFVRIVNSDSRLFRDAASKYIAHPFYEHMRPATDFTSYLITDL